MGSWASWVGSCVHPVLGGGVTGAEKLAAVFDTMPDVRADGRITYESFRAAIGSEPWLVKAFTAPAETLLLPGRGGEGWTAGWSVHGLPAETPRPTKWHSAAFT